MKRFLATVLCLFSIISLVGCGQDKLALDDGLKMGEYSYDSNIENDYMPSLILLDDSTFEISYKGYVQGNMKGSFVIDSTNNTLTCTTDDSEPKIYLFEIKDGELIFRNINSPLEVLNSTHDNFDGEVPDNVKFTYEDSEETTQE